VNKSDTRIRCLLRTSTGAIRRPSCFQSSTGSYRYEASLHGLTRPSNLGRLVRAEPSMIIGRGFLRSSSLDESSTASRCSRTKLDNGSTEWQRHIHLLGVKRVLKVDTHRYDCCKSGSYQDTSFQVSRGTMCSYQDAAAYSRGVTVSISSEPSAMRTSAESCLSLAIFMQVCVKSRTGLKWYSGACGLSRCFTRIRRRYLNFAKL